MLATCPECELQISNKARACPHCGYPLQKTAVRKTAKKRMRLPNGFGQISELKGSLRKPFRAMVSVGKNENGRPIVKPLQPTAYFATYKEAYEALMEYNKDPYDLSKKMSMQELYDAWSEEYIKSLKSDSSYRTIKAAWAYCSPLANYQVTEIRTRHLKGCISDSKASDGTKARMKSVFNLMFDYAIEHEILRTNPARAFKISEQIKESIEMNKKDHLAFTDEEMKILWSYCDLVEAEWVLIQCYTGLRPTELCLLKKENINLEKNYIIAGMKTKAGTNRRIPIHPCIKQFIKELMFLSECDYLLFGKTTGEKITYSTYKYYFNCMMRDFGLNVEHRPHDPRKTFVTMAKKYDVDEYAIKRIVGHAIVDLTENVYTDRTDEWLNEEIEKIKTDGLITTRTVV